VAGKTGGIRAGKAFVEIFAEDATAVRTLKRFEARMRAFGNTINNIGRRVFAFGLAGAGGLGLLGGAAVRAAGQFEQLQVSFETMLGSAEKASELLKGLSRFAAETPFELTEIGDAAKQLLAFGTASDEIVPTLTMLGDLSAGLNIPLGDMAYLFGTTRVQGRLFAQDLNQFVGRGIPLIQELAKQFRVPEAQVRKLVEEGKVGFPQVQQALQNLTGEGSQFGGLMAKQSRTLFGLLSTLRDNLAAVARSFGAQLLPMVKSVTTWLLRLTGAVTTWIERNPELVRQIALIGTAGFVAFAAVAAVGAGLIGAGLAAQGAAALIGLTAAAVVKLGLALKAGAALLAALTTPLGAVVTLLIGIGGYAAWSSGVFGQAVERMRGAWSGLTTDMQTAWRGVVDAIAAGDLQLAMEIIRAGFNVAWLTVTGQARELWADLLRLVSDTTAFVASNVASVFIDSWATIQSGWAAMVGGMRAAWALLSREVGQTIDGLKIGLQLLRGQTPNFGAFGQRALDRNRQAGTAVAGAVAGTVGQQVDIERNRLDNQQSNRDELNAKLAASEGQQDARIAAAQEELRKAREALRAATEKARTAQESQGKTSGSGSQPRLPAVPSLGQLAGAGASVVGTFNAAAARGFGSQKDWGRDIAANTASMDKKLGKLKGAAFA
jgi:tape measure domain-containing protein